MLPDSRLRAALFGAAVTTQLAALTTHLISTTVSAIGLVLLLAAWLVGSTQQSTEASSTYVTLAATMASLVCVVYGLTHMRGDVAVRSFAPLLVVLQSVLLANRDRRSCRLVLVLSVGLLIASASVASSVPGGLPVVVSLVAVLFAVALARRSALIDQVHGAVSAGCCSKHPPRILRSRASVAVVCLVTALIGWLLLPPAFAGDFHHNFGRAGATSAQPTTPSTLAALSGGDIDLRVRGRLADEPVLEVSAASPLLWRGGIYSTYDGSRWSRVRRTAFQRVNGFGNERSLAATETEPPPHGQERIDSVAAYIPPFDGTVVAPGAPVGILANTDVFADGTGSYVLAPARSYVVRSVVAPTDETTLRAASGPDLVDPEWTQLPASLPHRVASLALSITARAPNRYAAVADIEHWLRTHATYRLDSPVPGDGEDAVDDFLFRDHTGFCEQFAAAETVLLRTLDIPARLVTGLAYGEPSVDPGQRLLRASDAHAWVEVYYPGVGWSASDPTAGAPLASGSRSWDARLRAAAGWLTSHLGGRKGAAIALATLLLAVAFAGNAWRGRRRAEAVVPTRADGPVLGAFRVLENRLTMAQPPVPARAPAESAREFLARVGLDATLASPLVVLESECYGSRAPDYARATNAADAFLQAAAAVVTVTPAK